MVDLVCLKNLFAKKKYKSFYTQTYMYMKKITRGSETIL